MTPADGHCAPHIRMETDASSHPNRAARVRVGTSGWTYDGWRGRFYPREVPKRLWLRHYASYFSTAEVNGSFYRTPSIAATRGWRDGTPDGFVFSWKASKFITHWKRLTERCTNSIELMDSRLRELLPKVATVLFQLPPQFAKNPQRLEAFLAMLPPRYRYSFEFRHNSWYDDDILALLQRHDAALCLSDHGDAPAPWTLTASHVYVRGHGPTGRYHGSYSARALRRWAQRIAAWRDQNRDVLVYFDNDQKAAAPGDALRLIQYLREEISQRIS